MDPLEFQHRQMMNESLPMGLRCSIATAITPYHHPKLGLASTPRYVEVPIVVPDFQSVDEAESFLLTLSQRVGAGELAIDSANDVAAHVRGWIHSIRQGQELELKRLNADASTGEQVIRIEGGLPPLPGTSIIMPLPDKPTIEADNVPATESIASEVPDGPSGPLATNAPDPAA
jgi:hypothetical protein